MCLVTVINAYGLKVKSYKIKDTFMKTLYLSLACCIASMSIIGLQAAEKTKPNQDYEEVSSITCTFNPTELNQKQDRSFAKDKPLERWIRLDKKNCIETYEVTYTGSNDQHDFNVAIDAKRLDNRFGFLSKMKQYFGRHGGNKRYECPNDLRPLSSSNSFFTSGWEYAAKMEQANHRQYNPATDYVQGSKRVTMDVTRNVYGQTDTVTITTHLHKDVIKDRCRRAKIFTGVVVAGAAVGGGIAYFGLPKQSGMKNPKAS